MVSCPPSELNQYTPYYHLYGHYTRERISLDLIRDLVGRI